MSLQLLICVLLQDTFTGFIILYLLIGIKLNNNINKKKNKKFEIIKKCQ